MDDAPIHRVDTWDLVPDALIIVDAEGIIVDANGEALRLVGIADLVGRSVDTLVPDPLVDHAALRDGCAAAPSRRAMGAAARLSLKRADGSVVPAHIALAPLGGGLVLAAVRDISDSVQAEDRLIDANRRRILAEDHERIARDLHDRIIQTLFALGMDLEAGLAGPAADHPQRISNAVDTLDDVIRAIRDVIFDVRRSRPDDTSVHGRAAHIIASLIPSLGFEPAVEVTGDLDALPDQLVDHVLAVVRESLTNVARHADASAASVTVRADPADVAVTVTDDGRGLPPAVARKSGHANLADRARIANGEFRIESRAEGGTIVTWRAPRPHPSEDETP